MKPYSESCDQNREPILAVIEPLFASSRKVLEIGSGTGQHAIYFASQMPHLEWQTSDLAENHAGINLWLEGAGLENVKHPLTLDVGDENAWNRVAEVDAVFTANTLHIMSERHIGCLFKALPGVLQKAGLFALYGPFNYGGKFTSPSNARFDEWLKYRDPSSGVRDFEWLNALAQEAGMSLLDDVAMPANNRMLVWKMNQAL